MKLAKEFKILALKCDEIYETIIIEINKLYPDSSQIKKEFE